MIGVGVEGPSDMHFWRKVLHRSFPGEQFRVHNMRTREQLIAKTPALWSAFRDAGYRAAIIVIDRESDPCFAEVLGLFDESSRSEMTKPFGERRLFLAMADRKIESWFLADKQAIQTVLPRAEYEIPQDTSTWGVGKLEQLWREHHGRNSTLNKIEFAKLIAPAFSATRASIHSLSFRRAWERIEHAVQDAPMSR